ncbi:MAG TPA: DinB family protein [Bacteroidia bacterium]|jgi:uncharacterized damage-inducible protein DinB|nr:DinB family protein [Bacteroidia bacterium]
MTTSGLLKDYAKYNLWANKNLADLLRTIDQALLTKEVKSSYPSLRKTCFHIWDAEFVWFSRLNGTSPTSFPSNTYGPEVHPSGFIDQSAEFLAFLDEQDEDFFNDKTTFTTFDGKEFTQENEGIIMHVMNHSSFHRGQLVMMLRILAIPE